MARQRVGAAAEGSAEAWSEIRRVVDRSAYDAYVERQAQALLELIPRDALRPLYGRAREWARKKGLHDQKDPMATLLRFCGELLPLPPFDVWLEDVARHATGHVADLRHGPGTDESSQESIPVESRSFRGPAGEKWVAALSVFRAGAAWKGLISFHRGSTTPVLRTAPVFREDGVDAIRARFRTFDRPALLAFLRSVRP